MKGKIISVLSAMALVSGAAFGQQAYGLLMTQSQFKTTDMLQLSQYNYGFGTARSAAMGGAFASLGSDLSSMSINPAGLGMYRSSEFSLTPSVINSKTDNGPLQWNNGVNNRTRFAVDNLGLAINVYESSRRGLTSLTVGFAYNKLADFNFRSGTALPTNDYSINEVFVQQLRGVPSTWLPSSANPFDNYNIGLDQWGAVMAWKTQAIDNIDEGGDLYTIRAIDPSAMDDHYTQIYSQGSIGEYSIAVGANLNNKVYLGASIGIQNIYRKQTVNFDEVYMYDDPTMYENPDLMQYMQYDQTAEESGAAVNFKFGVIVRPIESLRIGMAIHTPSFVSVDRSYYGSMYTRFNGPAADNYGESSTGKTKFTNKYSTPARLQLGASYTLGSFAIFAVDYERVWYNGMRLGGADTYRSVKDSYKAIIKDSYKAANNLRVGVEIKPIPLLAVRAGYALYDSPLKDVDDNGRKVKGKDRIFDSPLDYRTDNISAGLGFRFNNFVSLDLTYVNMSTKHTGYDLFYYNGEDNFGDPIEIQSNPDGPIDSKLKRHNFVLTFGVRF